MRNILNLMIISLLLSCSNNEKQNPSITIFDESIENIINSTAEIEELVDSLFIPEGPVWDESSNSLLFVDVLSNKLYKWNEENGASEYISPSGNTGYAPNLGQGILGANGLAIDSEGNILACQHGDRRIARIANKSSNDPMFETIVDNFEGQTFNSPNDLTISKDGSIYFSDPAFGFFDLDSFQFVDSELRQLDFNGIYKYNPKTKITDDDPVISIENLQVQFETEGDTIIAVNDATFKVHPGETVCLVGESGSGKSMTALFGISASGEIKFRTIASICKSFQSA